MSELKLIQFKSYPKKTAFAAEWDYFICESNISDVVDFNNIKKIILEIEKDIINKYSYTHDWGTGLGPSSLTSRSDSFNLLKIEGTEDLKAAIKKTHDDFVNAVGIKQEEEIYAQCWANVLRTGEVIKKHRHWFSNYAYLCGHICVQQENTRTHYVSPYTDDIYPSINESGKITLFPAWAEHFTDQHVGKEERITIAFDIIPRVTLIENIMEHKHEHWIEL
jgi:hypothetical protein